MTPAVDRLIDQAVEQGHPRRVTDTAALAAVATIIATVARRQEVRHDRQAA
jgi:hypothetical protein